MGNENLNDQESNSSEHIILDARAEFERNPSVQLSIVMRAMEAAEEERMQEERSPDLVAFVK